MLSRDFTTCITSKWMAHVWFAVWSTHWMQETLEMMLLIMNQICVCKWMLHSTEGCFLVISACKLTQLFQVRWAAPKPVLLCDDQIHHGKLQLQFKIAHFTQFTACVQLSLPFQPLKCTHFSGNMVNKELELFQLSPPKEQQGNAGSIKVFCILGIIFLCQSSSLFP